MVSKCLTSRLFKKSAQSQKKITNILSTDCSGPQYYLCANERCIGSALRCNNDDDCGDGSDEMSCGEHIYPIRDFDNIRHLYLHIEVPTIATKGGTKKGVSLALIGEVVGGIAGEVVLMVIVGICIAAGVHCYRRHKRTYRITSATGDAQMMPVVNEKSVVQTTPADTLNTLIPASECTDSLTPAPQLAPAASDAMTPHSQLTPVTLHSQLTCPPEVCDVNNAAPLISAVHKLSTTCQVLITSAMDRQSLKSKEIIDQSLDHQLTTQAATSPTA